MRAAWPVLAGIVVGLAAGGIWTAVQSDRYRADARVFVKPASTRLLPAVEALAESSLVESNVTQTLHLSSAPDITAKRGDAGVLTVSAEASTRERARQIDAEAVVILTQKVGQRFPGVSATVLDPAHAAEQTSPTPGRNVLITGLIGLVLGLVAAAVRRRGARATVPPDREVERRLRARIDEVTKRERMMAQRAGQLAARESDLERREQELAGAASRAGATDDAASRRDQELEHRARELEARFATDEADPEPPSVRPAPAPVRTGGWTLAELESLVAADSDADAAQREEWANYLFFLREHAHADGTLPPSFDDLVNDVFGPIVRR